MRRILPLTIALLTLLAAPALGEVISNNLGGGQWDFGWHFVIPTDDGNAATNGPDAKDIKGVRDALGLQLGVLSLCDTAAQAAGSCSTVPSVFLPCSQELVDAAACTEGQLGQDFGASAALINAALTPAMNSWIKGALQATVKAARQKYAAAAAVTDPVDEVQDP